MQDFGESSGIGRFITSVNDEIPGRKIYVIPCYKAVNSKDSRRSTVGTDGRKCLTLLEYLLERVKDVEEVAF